MLSINISELIWTIINFFLLYFLLKHFLYDPVLRFIDARQRRLDEALEKEKAAQSEVEANDSRIEEEKASRRAEAKALIARSARDDAERGAQTIAAAEREAEAALAEAGSAIEAQSARDKAALESRTDELAELLARSILGGEQST